MAIFLTATQHAREDEIKSLYVSKVRTACSWSSISITSLFLCSTVGRYVDTHVKPSNLALKYTVPVVSVQFAF